jgi:CheY-like chemotaxis protein
VQTALGEAPAVLGSESEIREALLNLVLNAVDAMPQGGALRLATGRNASDGAAGEAWSGGAFVCVADTGTGMDEETLKRCLDPLFTTKGERGTGMGLAMVYSMAQRHGADLSIDSRPGAGTAITLRFPRPPGEAAAPPRQTPASAAQPAAALRVLVIDDDPLVLETLVTMLKATGQEVTAAQGGASGVEMFLAGQGSDAPFEVVFTDLGMPALDGRGVARAIKQAAPDTPVILLSGWGEALSADGEGRGDFDLVMAKPPRLRDLREALARYAAPAAEPRAR